MRARVAGAPGSNHNAAAVVAGGVDQAEGDEPPDEIGVESGAPGHDVQAESVDGHDGVVADNDVQGPLLIRRRRPAMPGLGPGGSAPRVMGHPGFLGSKVDTAASSSKSSRSRSPSSGGTMIRTSA